MQHDPGSQDSDFQQRSFGARLLLLAFHIVGLIPISLHTKVSYLLGLVAVVLPFREREIAKLQLSWLLPQARPDTLRKVVSNLLLSLLEAPRLRQMVARHYQLIEGSVPPDLNRFKQRERPVLALTAHTGNWDFLAGYMVAEGLPVYTIGRRAHRASFQYLLERIRSSSGVVTLWRSDPSTVRDIMGVLKRKEILAALIDQDLSVKGAHVPFLGELAHYPTSLIEMARKRDAQIVTCFCLRRKNGKFSILLKDIADDLSVEEVLREYSQRLEELIENDPSQWVWIHKRWRTRPDGRRLSSKEYGAWLKSQLVRRDCHKIDMIG